MNLFDNCADDCPDPAKPLYRRGNPETSREAAESAVPTLGERQRWAAECVRQRPGLTARELAAVYCPDDPKRIDRRLGECEKLRTVRRGDPRTCSRSGRRAATWYPPESTGVES